MAAQKTASLRPRLLMAAAALLVAVATGGALYFSLPKPAPDVGFTSIKGEQISLHDLHGKVVLVEFWATTCRYCVQDMPQMADIYRRLQPQGLAMIAVAMSYDRPDYVVNFTESRKLPFAVALDLQGELAAAFGGVAATPTLFLIGKDGKVLKRYVGEPDFAELQRRLQQALLSS